MKLTITLLITLLSAVICDAADINAYIRDTQTTRQDGKFTTMIWWTPKSYWKEALRQDTSITEEIKESLASIFDRYTVVAVCRAQIGPLGTLDATGEPYSEETIRVSINGKPLKYLTSESLDAEAQQTLAIMKPVFAQSLGQFGKLLEFNTFEKPSEAKNKLVEELEGNIDISAFNEKVKFRLPLAAILPEKTDAKTGETFPGNYLYNPYTGKSLK